MENDLRGPTLGEVVSLVRGTTYKSALLGQPGPVLLGLASIERNGGFRADSLKTYGGDSPSKLLLSPGDLYVSLKDVTQSGDLLGAIARVPKNIKTGRLTQDTVKLDFGESKYPRNLLYWALRTPQYRAYCRAHATGTTNLGLGREDFLAYRLPAATKEALYLVAVLDALDEKIELSRKQNETLEAMARALFKAWFVDFEPVRAKMEGRWQRGQSLPGLPAHLYDLFPDRLVESELGEIPEGWETKRVSDYLSLAYGKSLPAGKRQKGIYPVYGSGGLVGFHNEAMINGPTVIVGRKGTVGSLYWEDRPCFPIDTVFYVQPKVPLSFCYYLLKSLPLKDMNTDAAVPGLNRENVYRLEVAAPPRELVSHFAETTSRFRESIAVISKSSEALSQLRDTILPKLISGELRVSKLDIQGVCDD